MQKNIAHYVLYDLTKKADLPMETLSTNSLISDIVEKWNHRIYVALPKDIKFAAKKKKNYKM